MSSNDTETPATQDVHTKKSFVSMIKARILSGIKRVGRILGVGADAVKTAMAAAIRVIRKAAVGAFNVVRTLLALIVGAVALVVFIAVLGLALVGAGLSYLSGVLDPSTMKRVMKADQPAEEEKEAKVYSFEDAAQQKSKRRHPSARKGRPTNKRPNRRKTMGPVTVV